MTWRSLKGSRGLTQHQCMASNALAELPGSLPHEGLANYLAISTLLASSISIWQTVRPAPKLLATLQTGERWAQIHWLKKSLLTASFWSYFLYSSGAKAINPWSMYDLRMALYAPSQALHTEIHLGCWNQRALEAPLACHSSTQYCLQKEHWSREMRLLPVTAVPSSHQDSSVKGAPNLENWALK